MSEETTPGKTNVEKMNEYRELVDHTRQLRKNALELDDLVDEMQWIAAGGRGAVEPNRVEKLIEASRLIAEDLEQVYSEAPDPYELRES